VEELIPFSYKITKDNKVLISREQKLIKVIKGRPAIEFISDSKRMDESAIQMSLAKLTGNYKRGNERQGDK